MVILRTDYFARVELRNLATFDHGRSLDERIGSAGTLTGIDAEPDLCPEFHGHDRGE